MTVSRGWGSCPVVPYAPAVPRERGLQFRPAGEIDALTFCPTTGDAPGPAGTKRGRFWRGTCQSVECSESARAATPWPDVRRRQGALLGVCDCASTDGCGFESRPRRQFRFGRSRARLRFDSASRGWSLAVRGTSPQRRPHRHSDHKVVRSQVPLAEPCAADIRMFPRSGSYDDFPPAPIDASRFDAGSCEPVARDWAPADYDWQSARDMAGRVPTRKNKNTWLVRLALPGQ